MEDTKLEQAKRRLQPKNDWSLKKLYHDTVDKASIKGFLSKNIWKSKADADALYDWKYERNPFGKTLMFVGEKASRDVIALGIFMPWALRRNSEAIGACQWIDLVVSFSYRGQGIPDKVLQDGLSEFRNNNSPVCFAFPNANSIPVHKENNGFLLGYITRYVKPLRTEYLIKRFIKAPFLARLAGIAADFFLALCSRETWHGAPAGLAVERVSTCGSDFDEFWQRLREKFSTTIMTEKTKEYLNWKYINTPKANRELYCAKKDGRIEGFIVLESAGRLGYVIDVAAIDTGVLEALIAFAIKHFRQRKEECVVFVCLENNAFLDAFKRFGFLEREGKKHFYIYLGEQLEHKEQFQDSRNWLVTIGDCDIDSM